eukprot:357473-Chlamydomonas_euryale.AAC.13
MPAPPTTPARANTYVLYCATLRTFKGTQQQYMLPGALPQRHSSRAAQLWIEAYAILAHARDEQDQRHQVCASLPRRRPTMQPESRVILVGHPVQFAEPARRCKASTSERASLEAWCDAAESGAKARQH